ncbi:hypothetical protein DACRYDRAFT_96490 [Dacryopinax primogenitus]|uniref:Uncharacterized protein n=1 Tax=Dacryopinax primogenitus (strain DJM 731) TaxID=1858805 RepID=M5FSF6_DACPD|nr:uncharacterized protein DACRYDRAFT_96490 [Dacryopinax primogenitus]EJT98788.1 hypothetical protein DACRYDRAFT_96490 [Dacryopinax primogenitus]
MRQGPRAELPSLPSESSASHIGTVRMERKASTASTTSNSTLRGAPSTPPADSGGASPSVQLTPGGSRSLKDRLTNFPALSHSRPTTSIDTTPASATAPYTFSAASLTPHIASPSLPRRRRGSMRDSLQGLFNHSPGKANGNEERVSRRVSIGGVDDLELDPDPELDLDMDQERRLKRGGRYFNGQR